MRVASQNGHTHSHVQDSSGKTVTSGYGDCVNVGANIGDANQSVDCDKPGLKSATQTDSAQEEMTKPGADYHPSSNGQTRSLSRQTGAHGRKW